MSDASLPPIIAPEPLFRLGQLVVTTGALHALARARISSLEALSETRWRYWTRLFSVALMPNQ
jgi:hypothetical protein